MIEKYVEKFMKNKNKLEKIYSKKHPDNYLEIVKDVVSILYDKEDYSGISEKTIHEINDGDYQGTLLYIIASNGYQPSDYWYVKVNYGSCSGCDTLQAIHQYSSGKPTKQQTKDYLNLCLNIVQGLKKME